MIRFWRVLGFTGTVAEFRAYVAAQRQVELVLRTRKGRKTA